MRVTRLKEIRVVTTNGVFIAKSPKIWMPFTKKEYEKAYQEEFDYYKNYFIDKKMSKEEAWIEHTDRVNRRLAKRFGFKYEFKKW
jgi:hypothetical protein